MKSILDFQLKKKKQQPISMVTCYDYGFAKIIEKSNVDTILVGDSVAQVIHGYPNTLHATTEMMALHTAAVAKGAPSKFIVTDMPFLTTRLSIDAVLSSVKQIMTAGAHALKIEGAQDALTVKHIVDSGVPVMGHLGLTPQSIHQLGGPKIQGKTQSQADKLLADALTMQDSGCFALVLECIPADLAQKISEQISIPTIGIGAGSHTDGQVLVLNDLLGMNPDFNPKFLKKYTDGYTTTIESLNTYVNEVQTKKFPALEHSY